LIYTHELEDLLNKEIPLPDYTNITLNDSLKMNQFFYEFLKSDIYNNQRRINELLTIYIKHRIQRYGILLNHLNYIENHSKLLDERCKQYYQSKLFKSLSILYNMKEKLICYIRNNDSEKKYDELLSYTQHILDIHYW